MNTPWIKPAGEGPDERPRIQANHLGPRLPGTRFHGSERLHGWWACYYDKGRFCETFASACRAAVYLRTGRWVVANVK